MEAEAAFQRWLYSSRLWDESRGVVGSRSCLRLQRAATRSNMHFINGTITRDSANIFGGQVDLAVIYLKQKEYIPLRPHTQSSPLTYYSVAALYTISI